MIGADMAIKYLGSKRLLVNDIYAIISGPGITSVADIFSGTARVGQHFKKNGLRVVSSDITRYAKVIADCYVKADRETYYDDAKLLVDEYNSSSDTLSGYFTETFCVKSRFFHPNNGERIDYIREDLERKSLDPVLKNVMLTSLMDAADKVDSTCGLQMAYLKQYAKRASKKLFLKVPELTNASAHGDCEVFQCDASEMPLKLIGENSVDAVYLDPPYNAHSYLANYHIWESLCLWDKPEVYGIACKRVDVKDRKSPYNFKKTAIAALDNLVQSFQVKKIVVSFNDEGFINKDDMELILGKKGNVTIIEKDYKRYIGAQIGIHNNLGDKVGEVSHTRNKEYLYLVETEPRLVEQI